MSLDQSDRQRCISDALRSHADELRGFVRARVPPADADDVLQMAALRAVERAASLEDPARVRSWLFAIHRNLVTDTLRRQVRSDRLLGLLQPPEPKRPVVGDICDCSVVQARQLRPAYASILALIDAGGASLTEAARQLGVSPNNAAVRLHRARKALRQAMRDHCGVESVRDCFECRCVFDGCCAV